MKKEIVCLLIENILRETHGYMLVSLNKMQDGGRDGTRYLACSIMTKALNRLYFKPYAIGAFRYKI